MRELTDARIGLASIAVGILCAVAAALGAPLLVWAIAAGVAAGMLAYALLVRRDEGGAEGSDVSPGDLRGPSEGPGSGSDYRGSHVINVTVQREREE